MSERPLFVLSHPLSPSSVNRFGPRVGRISIDREDGTPVLHSDTPALLTATSRGVVAHLSRDHVRLTRAIQHIHLHFESFLDKDPPVPTLVAASHPLCPLHTFLGYSPENHIITLSLRDPSDGRRMPPNGNDFVSALCTRGVRKVDPTFWNMVAQSCKPDIVIALSDTPFTSPPHSQKRLTKSIERSIAWLAGLLKVSTATEDPKSSRPRNVLVHLAGGINVQARAEFSDRLTEPIEQKDAAGLFSFNTLDDGVAGYVLNLLPLHAALAAESSQPLQQFSPADELLHISDHQRSSPKSASKLTDLLRASLERLPMNKVRIVNSPVSPHEILRIVRDVGVDLVDGVWAQRAADIGIALDFRFPVPALGSTGSSPPRTRQHGKRDLGHNLFDSLYLHDHSRLASSFLDGQSAEHRNATGMPVCGCAACSSRAPDSRLLHSPVDYYAWQDPQHPLPTSAHQPPVVRSYIHHLLHTHEMSSHSLLVMHNLAILSSFLAGVRAVLLRGDSANDEFAREVERFEQTYDEDMLLWDEAEKIWLEVEQARGKGRIAREKEKQAASTIGTAVDLA